MPHDGHSLWASIFLGAKEISSENTPLGKVKLAIANSVTNKKSDTQTLLSLNDVNSDTPAIKAQFAKWDNFQTTDYADIGDNESDPFLAKMINLGFIEHGATGFYNQQGEAIQGGHHH